MYKITKYSLKYSLTVCEESYDSQAGYNTLIFRTLSIILVSVQHNLIQRFSMIESTKQVKKFDAEVGKVLDLVINSIYKNKDIFLRELISNSSDACSKLRHEVLSKNLSKESSLEYKIKIEIDAFNKKLIISDNGIGMNREDLVTNIGTIASSGTQKFISKLSNKNEMNNQIGQFGIGFYSAFMVSEKVKIITSKAFEDVTYEWISSGKGEYTIGISDEKINTGTRLVLDIKETDYEFLDPLRIEQVINRYCDHIDFPIELTYDNKKSKILNKSSAIWTRNPSEISTEEYEKFFHTICDCLGKPWMVLHNNVEGAVHYTNLLFIPESKPIDLLGVDRKSKVKLYIKKVFISEEENELVPGYLRFLRGVVDSEDLPLNLSRETLQSNKIVHKIRTSIAKKVLSELKKKVKNSIEEYLKFWGNFREILKEGLYEASEEEKKEILEVCRFSSISTSQLISLDDYVKNMLSNQKAIYYLNGESTELIKKHPQLEGFRKRGIDVILLVDHIDNFWINVVTHYKSIEFKSITTEKIDLNKIKQIDDKATLIESGIDGSNNIRNLTSFIKKVLKDRVKDVVISSKLVDSPACISTIEGDITLKMEKFLMEQKQLSTRSAKILEINPKHAILKKVSSLISNETEVNDKLCQELIEIVYGQACLVEGVLLDNPGEFVQTMNSLLTTTI